MTENSPTSRRFTLVEKDLYKVDLEYNENFAIIHLPYVRKFSRGIYEDMLNTFLKIKRFVYDMGYSNIWVATEEPKALKLASRMGFQYRGSSEGLDVYVYEEKD